MRNRQQRLRKPDLLVVLALVVGLGAVLSTSVQAEEAPVAAHNDLFISYKGALPALRKRFAAMAGQADGLLRQVESVLPIEPDEHPFSVSLAAPEITPAVTELRHNGGFVVEEEATMTLIFSSSW